MLHLLLCALISMMMLLLEGSDAHMIQHYSKKKEWLINTTLSVSEQCEVASLVESLFTKCTCGNRETHSLLMMQTHS